MFSELRIERNFVNMINGMYKNFTGNAMQNVNILKVPFEIEQEKYVCSQSFTLTLY